MELVNHAKSDITDGLVVLWSYFVSISFDDFLDLYCTMVH